LKPTYRLPKLTQAEIEQVNQLARQMAEF